MIFVTVGGQLPFDRLIALVDNRAAESGQSDVFAQIGASEYKPKQIEVQPFLTPEEFSERLHSADLIIAHAGMGTILQSLEAQKTIVVLPRRHSLGEHRNDHQLATAHHFREMGKIQVAMEDEELRNMLDHAGELGASEQIGPHASESLLNALRGFVSETVQQKISH